ncbi:MULTISPECIES: MarR family winged helix-turn-helix transcriptional regulator [Streptomyces]|uniref:MarR family winged helix-turn-helix transcriptional regulator n=1 Tax=Streptomyces cyaneofuscatus TaxID=66883 RepID=A0ABZ1F0K5_9ACTN|nr:MarR family winged helix-turn-helix transcriptional regulator [Streptomyces cyaneofuscatus]WSB09888.1 MarR family winged helix-turn-helix transcriptional regulator [Streptomyces cyaneofuscatus]WSD46579.1 MarR family winged helix-turn-helix transcriptional regulator [Streptomyces cyaneofuscatus]
MDYSHDDAGLARQPIGYWSWAAHEATVTHIRAALAEHGLTQPPWWVINQLIGAEEDGRGRAELAAFLGGYLDTGADGIEAAVGELLDRGLITQDDGARLRLTPEGRALRDRAFTRVMRAREEIHEGVTDEEFVAALKVLQRMIHNVGGKAWHE